MTVELAINTTIYNIRSIQHAGLRITWIIIIHDIVKCETMP